MVKILRILVPFFLFFFAAGSMSALTFMVDTRETVEFNELEADRRLRVVATETAVMDALFDNGHIFFSMYTYLDGGNDEITDLLPLHHSQREGVDYLIRLSPNDDGVDWNLYSIKPIAEISSGQTALDDTDVGPEAGSLERWTAVGQLVVEQILRNIPNN